MKEIIKSVNLNELHAFPNNPYKIIKNEEFNSLVESIKDYGIISPLVVRPIENGAYEIIAGHRRVLACKEAGIEKVPAFIREMDNDMAVIALVDSNLNREHILPSEKAFAYKMKLDAIKHQGVTSRQVGEKLSVTLVGEYANESERQVHRYIRLTNLIPELLEMVDEEKIALSPAVDISFLAEQEQFDLLETIKSEDRTPSLSQAQRMKQLSAEGRLNMDVIFAIMTEEKANQKEKVSFKTENIRQYFPNDYSIQKMQETIIRLLEQWQRQRTQQYDRGYSR
jgi:ParB family chromosome partitioning protein